MKDLPNLEYKEIFEHSASASFFAYLPIAFWKQVVIETNLYLVSKNRKVSGQTKVKDFTLDEMMTFLGILFYMELEGGKEYAKYWGEQYASRVFSTVYPDPDSKPFREHNFDGVMKKKRFECLRAALSFNTGATKDMLETDPLARIRPLIRVFNKNSGLYATVGRNLAVDESSIACRSKFGRGLIVYNPTKPTGKYHFRLYVMTAGDSFIIQNTIVHSRCTLEDELMMREEEESDAVEDFITEIEP